jgi:hypothetical protein
MWTSRCWLAQISSVRGRCHMSSAICPRVEIAVVLTSLFVSVTLCSFCPRTLSSALSQLKRRRAGRASRTSRHAARQTSTPGQRIPTILPQTRRKSVRAIGSEICRTRESTPCVPRLGSAVLGHRGQLCAEPRLAALACVSTGGVRLGIGTVALAPTRALNTQFPAEVLFIKRLLNNQRYCLGSTRCPSRTYRRLLIPVPLRAGSVRKHCTAALPLS